MSDNDIKMAEKELEGTKSDICLVLAHLTEIATLLRVISGDLAAQKQNEKN